MKNCNICEFRTTIIPPPIGHPSFNECMIKNSIIKYPRLKARFCKWFTLDGDRRKAIEIYNEIQAL